MISSWSALSLAVTDGSEKPGSSSILGGLQNVASNCGFSYLMAEKNGNGINDYPNLGFVYRQLRKLARLITQYTDIFSNWRRKAHGTFQILENISLYCVISLVNFRLLFNLQLLRSSTARRSGTSILSRWSSLKLSFTVRRSKHSCIFTVCTDANPVK